VALAARGARNMDEGDEPIGEDAERVELARQARRIHIKSIVAGLALTVLTFFAPE
jgi:hypothetical protein